MEEPMKRPTFIACLLTSALLAACAQAVRTQEVRASVRAGSSATSPSVCPPSPIPPGIYTKTITSRQTHEYARSHQVDYNAQALGFIVGTWMMYVGVADPNCYYTDWHPLRVNGQVVFVDAHPFTVVGKDRIVFHGSEEPDGLYEVMARPGYIRLIGLSDWGTRRAVHEIGPWKLVRAIT
jgi:hypothetical protein